MPDVMAMHVKCLDCDWEYDVAPAKVIGNHAWYSSRVDHCDNCESMNLETISFLHPEDVSIGGSSTG